MPRFARTAIALLVTAYFQGAVAAFWVDDPEAQKWMVLWPFAALAVLIAVGMSILTLISVWRWATEKEAPDA